MLKDRKYKRLWLCVISPTIFSIVGTFPNYIKHSALIKCSYSWHFHLCSPSDEETDEEFDTNEELDFEPSSKPQPSLSSSTTLKRSLTSSGLNLGPEISFKKFKSESKTPEKETAPTVGTKSFENESESNLSEDEMSYYDSDLGSESELQDLGSDLGLNLGLDDVLKNMETKPPHGMYLVLVSTFKINCFKIK